jgi:Ca2+-dependent lipid-binding protein
VQKVKKLERRRIVKGKFRIELLAAKNVIAVDREKSSDPYAVLQYGSERHQTRVTALLRTIHCC